MPTFSRESLHTLVWDQPIRACAERIGVRPDALRRACRDAGVPLPGPGHWTRLRAGAPAGRPDLPPRGPAQAHEVSFADPGLELHARARRELAEPEPPAPVFDEPLASVRVRIAAHLGRVTVLPTLDRASPAVRRVLADGNHRGSAATAGRARLAAAGGRFETPFEQRRLRLLNSLAFGLARMGATLHVHGVSAREIDVVVGRERLQLRLDAPGARPNGLGAWPTRPGPVGALTLHVLARTEDDIGSPAWDDAATRPLEDRLAEIAADLLVEAEARYRADAFEGHARRVAWRARMAAEQQARQADALRRAREREAMRRDARRERLADQARDWRAARDIRAFVAEVLAEAGVEDPAPESLATWRTWALAEADALDPTVGGLAPWVAADDETFERRCGCGFDCARYCGCGQRMACACDCPGEQDQDTDHWQRFPDSGL